MKKPTMAGITAAALMITATFLVARRGQQKEEAIKPELAASHLDRLENEPSFIPDPAERVQPEPAHTEPGVESEESFFAPTLTRFTAWFSGRFDAATAARAWEQPGVQEAWALSQEKLEVSTWLVEYQEREYARWEARETSVAIWDDLGAERLAWLHSHAEKREAIDALLSLYGDEVIALIWVAGDETPSRDDPESRWQLFFALEAFPAVASASALLEKALQESKL